MIKPTKYKYYVIFGNRFTGEWLCEHFELDSDKELIEWLVENEVKPEWIIGNPNKDESIDTPEVTILKNVHLFVPEIETVVTKWKVTEEEENESVS